MTFFTPAQLAERYQVHTVTVWKWIAAGLLPAFRVGKVTRIYAEDEERFRRLRTWHAGTGGAGHSVAALSGAAQLSTSTGALSRPAATASADGTDEIQPRVGCAQARGRGEAGKDGFVSRAQGGPIRPRRHGWIGPMARLFNRIGLRRVALRLWSWGGFYVVGERGPEFFYLREPHSAKATLRSIV